MCKKPKDRIDTSMSIGPWVYLAVVILNVADILTIDYNGPAFIPDLVGTDILRYLEDID